MVTELSNHHRVAAAAEASGASRAIERLANGYDTMLGTQFGNGRDLSIGEWQKVAIARGIMRSGEIVLLDEPTAALDPASEHQLLATIRQMARDRICVVISHRLSAARQADRIVVLQDRTVVEQGCHDDLIRKGGVYERLFRIQASSYTEQAL